MPLFTEEDIKGIAKELGIQTTPGFFNSIGRIAENYFSFKNFWEHRENTAELRADLQKVSNRASDLIKSLQKLSPLGGLALKHYDIDLEQSIIDIRNLQKSVQNEVQHLKFGKRGPSKNVPLIIFITDLAMLYREKTGKNPGVSTNWETLDRGGPFLRFIMACLRTVEPNIYETDHDEQRIGELIKKNLNHIKSVIESFQKEGYFSY